MGAVGRTLYFLYIFALVYLINNMYGLHIFLMLVGNNESLLFLPHLIPLSMLLSCMLSNAKIDNNKQIQQSIENFCWHRILIASAVVCLNVLFPVAMILMFLGGWINALASILIYLLLICPPIILANVILESESPIKYTFAKTTKLTNLQKVSIFTFFTIMEVYYIYLCTWTHPSQNEYNVMNKLWSESVYLCPIINMMSIPAVIVACYAHNSEKINLSRLRPDDGLEHIGIRTWNPAKKIWRVDEKPEEHGVLEV